MAPPHGAPGSGSRPRLGLLGGFSLWCGGRPRPLPHGAQSVFAYLGLHGGGAPRPRIAAALWPRSDDRRAAGNLRSVLWRLPEPCRATVVIDDHTVGLAHEVTCDVWDMTDQARRLVAEDEAGASGGAPSVPLSSLVDDLLPAWYDDWVLVERDRLQQLRVRALEALSRRLVAAGRFGEAIDAGLAAVAAEPLGEGSHQVVIEAHLAEGNVTEAVRQYDHYRSLLDHDLGASPTNALRAVVEAGLQQ